MLFIKYLLLFTGFGLLAGAIGIVLWDLRSIFKPKKEPESLLRGKEPFLELRHVQWRFPIKLALAAILPFVLALSITVVPSGTAGVRVNQFVGPRPDTLYPGVHLILPGIETVQLYNIRDQMFTTTIDDTKKKEALKVQTQEGLTAGLAIAVRYRLEAQRLAYMYGNLPQPVEGEMVDPVVASVFRELAPHYLVREIFSTKREQLQKRAAARIAAKLAPDGIVVKEVVLRDIQLPADYARGLEGLLLKEQENEAMNIEVEVKQKLVRTAELEAEAQKAREIKQAEAQAAVTVLHAKAQADAMQHTLPLKEKQIQQSRLEAQARKEATVMNADAMGQAKIIDGKAELARRKLMNEADEDHIRRVAVADAERLRLESDVVKQNPLLIQKIIAEKLSDKVQIMMVPNDGKFFFANDVLKGATVSGTPQR
jgi:regulator of protease activity HflC (stomatin/prohibitin superfamily)